jgi:NAD(P)-dependent dehydrogenase (short-subunit alcohol dehydrogenase family)
MKDVAVVTGGSLGIGADVCQRFLEAGMSVLNLSNQPPKIEHAELQTIDVDLTDREATRALAADIAADHAVSRFVHCAGAVRPALMEEVKPEDMDYLNELQINSALSLAQAFTPGMKERNFGRIVMISTRGILGLKTRTAYAASKSAMLGMARAWALELAEFGITVNVIAPGPIDTEMFRDHVDDADVRARLAKDVPVGRLGTAADIGRVIDFFCDKDSGFITGQTWYVCGGASLGVLTM